jgi:transcriptional regulator with XRE-family HTH domain
MEDELETLFKAYTPKEIAQLSGVNVVTVWRWRTGRSKMPVNHYLKLIRKDLH